MDVGLLATVVGPVAGVAAVGVGVWQSWLTSAEQRQRRQQGTRELLPDGGTPDVSLSLTGKWWAGWQTWNQGQKIVATQPVEMEQDGAIARIWALERSGENVRGGYVWAGELRFWDNHVFMGS